MSSSMHAPTIPKGFERILGTQRMMDDLMRTSRWVEDMRRSGLIPRTMELELARGAAANPALRSQMEMARSFSEAANAAGVFQEFQRNRGALDSMFRHIDKVTALSGGSALTRAVTDMRRTAEMFSGYDAGRFVRAYGAAARAAEGYVEDELIPTVAPDARRAPGDLPSWFASLTPRRRAAVAAGLLDFADCVRGLILLAGEQGSPDVAGALMRLLVAVLVVYALLEDEKR